MRVSVVICTLNRAESLVRTLESLRYQRYGDLEVVVVNGPSTDGTDEALVPWADRVRIVRCEVANLSIARNIGIRSAGGDVVAFIDDDALPEFDWLVQAVPSFEDEEVAGVGGLVFDHTGLDLQYCFSASNRFGETSFRDDRPYDDQCFPGSFQFPYLQGTNALFRRSALLRVGGFDETYDYHLDETDLCCRLVDAGFVLRQLRSAPVHHKFLPSDVRNDERIVTDWFRPTKNQTYFCYRHALGTFSEDEVLDRLLTFIEVRVRDTRWHEDAGRLPAGAGSTTAGQCVRGLEKGLELGRAGHDRRIPAADWPAPAFTPFPTVDVSRRRRITFVSSGYAPNLTGGIARFISDLAPALARRGHEVRVVTSAVGPPAVDLEDGVWVHRIEPEAQQPGVAADAAESVDAWASAVLAELERIGGWSSHDLVYGPMWDVEIIGALRRTNLPVVLQIATPVAIAAGMAGHLDDPSSADTMRRLIELEGEVLHDADLFHANSAAVLETMRSSYGTEAGGDRWGVVHLGLRDLAAATAPPPATDRTRVLFVGRFEVRKGIDTLLEAMPSVLTEHPDVEFVAAGEDRPLAPGERLAGAAWLESHRAEAWIGRTRLEGEVDDVRLHELYASADVVVLPSRYESFGLVMAEAMMHGKAVVSCDTSGVREVVRDGIDGLLVPPGDAAALGAAIRSLLADPDRRAAMGAEGRRRFTEQFTADRFAERFDGFLQRVQLHGPVSTTGCAERRRNEVGADETLLGPGATAEFALPAGAGARLCLAPITDASAAVDPTEVEVQIVEVGEFDGAARTVRLVGDRVHRLAVEGSGERITVRATDRPVRVGGLIVVAPETH